MDERAAPAELPILRGERVLLRQPMPADVATRVATPRDAEEDRMYGGSGVPKRFTTAEVEAIFDRFRHEDLATMRPFLIAAQFWPDGEAIAEPDGRAIGHLRLHSISWQDRRARLAIGIFDGRFWSRGYGSEAIDLVLGYGFERMRLHRIDLRVLEYNTRAIRAYEKCGFVREGVERESAFVDGRWYDDVIMGILDHEYRARRAAQPTRS